MTDEPSKPGVPGGAAGVETVTGVPEAPPPSPVESGTTPSGPEDERGGGERIDRGITDFVRRAVSAGVGAASRSKDDLVRVAGPAQPESRDRREQHMSDANLHGAGSRMTVLRIRRCGDAAK